MGYRSDVAYLIISDTEMNLRAFLAHAQIQDQRTCAAINECVLNGKEIGVFFDNVKWYERYDEVISHETLWMLASEHQDTYKLAGAFCRVGEETDDLEERSIGDDPPTGRIGINRSIYTDFATNRDSDERPIT